MILAERGRARREARLARIKLWKTTAVQRFWAQAGPLPRVDADRVSARRTSLRGRECRAESEALLSATRGSGCPEVQGARKNAAGPRGLRWAFRTSGASLVR